MPLRDLGAVDREIVKKCLDCIAAGNVILHDAEFPSIMGLSVEEFLTVALRWPVVAESDPAVLFAVGNGLNNLLGYPHGAHDLIPVREAEIARVLALWRGRRIKSYFDGML
jgi:hypothetical protein